MIKIFENEVIYKYPLYFQRTGEIDLPTGAQILTVQSQKNYICLWALVNPSYKLERRRFRIAGTGEIPISEFEGQLMEYLGTIQVYEGDEIYHIFEMLN